MVRRKTNTEPWSGSLKDSLFKRGITQRIPAVGLVSNEPPTEVALEGGPEERSEDTHFENQTNLTVSKFCILANKSALFYKSSENFRRSSGPQVRRSAAPQICSSAGPQIRRSAGPQIRRSAGPQLRRFAQLCGAQIQKRCESVLLQRSTTLSQLTQAGEH